MNDFGASARMAAEWIESYRSRVADLPVLARVEPGDTAGAIPNGPPEKPETFEAILADLDAIIVPGLTHWNHPGFMAYFCSSAGDPGVLAEFVTAALNVNAMLWRTSPAATELETRMVGWLASFLGLPEQFRGVIQDTASVSTFVALVGARDRAIPSVRDAGLMSREGLGAATVYGSQLAHSSLDKAVIAAGLGHANLHHVAIDEEYRMIPDALDRAITADRREGRTPVMVCATIGTTSCASCDPVARIADVCERHGVWLHVDAAYAGPAASLGEFRPLFSGWERADSIVVNPHKWMAVPMDCSVLLSRRMENFRSALALTPEYLSTSDTEFNLMDVGVSLGRRFRALKLWFVFRWYGAAGIRNMIEKHCRLSNEFAARIRQDPRFDLAAAPRFSTVCFRAAPPDGHVEADWNRRLLARVNDSGRVFLSHTELDGRFAIRLTIGNVHTGSEHVEAAWDEVDAAARGA